MPAVRPPWHGAHTSTLPLAANISRCDSAAAAALLRPGAPLVCPRGHGISGSLSPSERWRLHGARAHRGQLCPCRLLGPPGRPAWGLGERDAEGRPGTGLRHSLAHHLTALTPAPFSEKGGYLSKPYLPMTYRGERKKTHRGKEFGKVKHASQKSSLSLQSRAEGVQTSSRKRQKSPSTNRLFTR